MDTIPAPEDLGPLAWAHDDLIADMLHGADTIVTLDQDLNTGPDPDDLTTCTMLDVIQATETVVQITHVSVGAYTDTAVNPDDPDDVADIHLRKYEVTRIPVRNITSASADKTIDEDDEENVIVEITIVDNAGTSRTLSAGDDVMESARNLILRITS